MSKFVTEVWFWYGLIICPILIILTTFGLGVQVGRTVYSEQPFSLDVWQIVLMSVLLLSMSEFRRAVMAAKVRFK
ncbi:hypothetical protein [Shewanella litoralis]|uniref:Uncharacterized protein n=1 Tax=Shewanella litoralis TaxID=2282700 RepID=A0ABQ2R4M0_9GAMM|nr:hypothetical protein [Shewanella litoralis]GGQ11102.1 hypothetical protein GCM10009411_09690 [Shewanella litoralis]